MYPYVISIITLLLLSIKEVFGNKFPNTIRNILFSIILITLSVLAGIRLNIGQDFANYSLIFNQINIYSDLAYMIEPGFRLIIVIAKTIGFSEQGLFFLFALITYSFTIRGLIKINHYPIFSFFMFFLLFNIGYVYNVIRQGIAMSIFIFLITDILENKTLKVLIFSLIAGSIHSIGYIIILIFLLKNINFKRSTYIVLTMLNLAIVPISSVFSGVLTQLLPMSLQTKVYSFSSFFVESVDIIGVSQRLLVIIIMLFYFNKLRNKFGHYFDFLLFTYFLGFTIYCIFSFQGMFATRINMYFKITEILLYPSLLSINIKNVEKLLLFLIVLLIALSIFSIEVQSPANSPFTTIFSNKY